MASEHGRQHLAGVLLAVIQPVLILLNGLVRLLLAVPVADLVAQAGADAELLGAVRDLEQGAGDLGKGGMVVKDGGDALLNAVQVQRVGAGLGALQGQVAVDVPPLAVQDLVEIGGVEAVDAQAPGQGGVDMGMGVHQPRHNDAALGINELRVRVLGLQLRRGTHRRDLGTVDGYAAIREIGDRLVPGDELAVCQNVHVFSSSYLLLNKRKMLQTLRFETLKHKLSDSCSPCARALRYSYHRIPFCSLIIADFSDDCNGN